SVKVQLAWFSVMGHFLLALALVSVALRMRQRAYEGPGPRVLRVAPRAALLVDIVVAWTIGVVVLGQLVTAAGPHGGDNEAKRLNIPLCHLARVPGSARALRVTRARV